MEGSGVDHLLRTCRTAGRRSSETALILISFPMSHPILYSLAKLDRRGVFHKSFLIWGESVRREDRQRVGKVSNTNHACPCLINQACIIINNCSVLLHDRFIKSIDFNDSDHHTHNTTTTTTTTTTNGIAGMIWLARHLKKGEKKLSARGAWCRCALLALSPSVLGES